MMKTNRPLLIFDFDSTLVALESLDELAKIALHTTVSRDEKLRKIVDITNAGMAGQIPFNQALQERLKLFAASRSHIAETISLLSQHITPSALQELEWLRANKDRVYVVSGGFKECIVPVATELLHIPAEQIFANEFTFDSDGQINGCNLDNLLSQDNGKSSQLRALGLTQPLIMIGDGHSDLQVKLSGVATTFVAFTENVSRPQVVTQADYVATNFSELRQLVATLS